MASARDWFWRGAYYVVGVPVYLVVSAFNVADKLRLRFCKRRPANDLHVFYDGQCDKVVASSPADAMAVWAEWSGERPEDYDCLEWEQLDDAAPLTIVEDPYSESGPSVTKTCAEWARDNGRGFLCSTEY